MSALIKRYSTVLLIAILSFAFVTRVYRLHEPAAYVFDEVYHAVTAKLISHNDPRAYEWWNPAPEPNTAVDWLHPPLAKYTQALGILIFGENSFGWRISSAIFGLLVIAMVYSLTKEAFESEGVALLAAGLASLDGLLLTQSRVAMNDIHVTFFILLTLTWYFKHRKTNQLKWLWLTGLGIGLAAASKWSGAFALAIVGLFEVLRLFKLLGYHFHQKAFSKAFTSLISFTSLRFLILLVLPISLYLLSYTQMFYQGKSFFCFKQVAIQGECYFDVVTHSDGTTTEKYISHFHELHKQIWWYQTNLEATHDYQSRPWQWFLNLRPVWYHVQYLSNQQIANIYALSNPALAWLGVATVMTTLLYFGYELGAQVSLLARKKTKIFSQTNTLNPLVFIVVSYLAVWLPWQHSPRIMFFYHYTPAIPLICILIAYWLTQLWNLHQTPKKVTSLKWNQAVVLSLLLVIALTFAVWYPQWTGIPVDKSFANTVYYSIKSWK
jgi:dolichyl-phosphate-mannose-protein mannosyltransferase